MSSRPSTRSGSGTKPGDQLPKGLAAGWPGQGTFARATLSRVALPELAELRSSLLVWLATAGAAGLDEDGIVALVTGALRDLREQRGETEGVA